MGIVEKQGIRGTIFSYAGAVIGFVTAGILQTRLFTPAENGVLELLVSWSLVFATVATLGLNNVTNRIFPWFRDPDTRHHGFSAILVWVSLAGFLFSMLLYGFLRPWIIETSLKDSEIFVKYVDFIIPLTAFTAIFMVADIYNAMLLNAVRGIFLKEFLQRILILAAILVFALGFARFNGFVILYCIALSIPGIIISTALIRERQFTLSPDRSHLTSQLKRQLASLAFYGVIIAFSNIMIQYIDRIMLQYYLGIEAVGIYGRAFIFGTLVSLPIRSVTKISSAVVAEQWKQEDQEGIVRLYRDTSLHQLIFGTLLFAGLWGNIHNVMIIMDEQYAEGRWVIFWIGISNLLIMASGISGAIMTTSRYYRVLALFVILFGILVILTNMIFIPKYGLAGAAFASALAALAYGLMRYFFLLFRYRMQPYTWRHLGVVPIAVLAWLPAILIPNLNTPSGHWFFLCLDIAIRSLAITLVFGALILAMRISPDLNRRAQDLWAQFKIRLSLHKPRST